MKILQDKDIPNCPNFKYGDIWDSLTAKKKGIENYPNQKQLETIIKMYQEVVQPLRVLLRVLIKVNSTYRSPELNKAVKGAKYSDHQCLYPYTNCAIDLDETPQSLQQGINNLEIIKRLIKSNIPFYKLIIEFPKEIGGNPSWIHISYSTNPNQKNQRNIYGIISTKYIPITSKDLKKWNLQ